MSRKAAALGINLLTLFTGGPTRKKQSRMRMRGILHDRSGVDVAGSFSQHVIHRRALSFPARVMMRVTGNAGRGLSRDEQLGELRMALMELDVVKIGRASCRERV